MHPRWLNQIEINFSIGQRFERHYESIVHPFEWTFTRADLNALMARMRSRYAETQPQKLAA